jgi:AraC family transcriptional regulator
MLAKPSGHRDHFEQFDIVKQYICKHIDEPLNREVLAGVVGFSVPHFHRIFTACSGENIASFVRHMRLERAGRKLRLGAVDITEVALAAGYETHAAFSKAFKRQYHISPSEFRRLHWQIATQLLSKG